MLALAGRPFAKDYRAAFPKIFRTLEVDAVINFCLENRILFFGFDCRIRINEELIPAEYLNRKEIYKKMHRETFGTDEYFTLRDRFMAETIAKKYKENLGSHLICLTHNLHARKNGSKESDSRIKLKSIREILDEQGIPTTSIALNCRSADYWDLECHPDHFEISDPQAIECDSRGDQITRISSADISQTKYCYNLGRFRESTPAWLNYDQFVLFNHVGPPGKPEEV